MIVVDEIREQIDVMLHPSKKIRARSVAGALRYYYLVSAVSLLLALVLTFALGGTAVAGDVGPALAIAVVAIYWIIIPLSMLLTAGVLHLLGVSLFRKFKGTYADTLSAVAYACSAVMLFYWLAALPYAGLALIVIAFWSVVIEIIGIAKLDKASRTAALGVIVGEWVLVVIILIAIMLALYGMGFFGAPITKLAGSAGAMRAA
jgi:hypothetical protein